MEDKKRIIIAGIDDLAVYEDGNGEAYSYKEMPVIPQGISKRSEVCFFKLPPHKSNFPYHYHLEQEETFFIISGHGILKTPEGEKSVRAGNVIFFPAGPNGAHKLTNASDSEDLVYIDFDATADTDVSIYPDSQKIGVWSSTFGGLFRLKDKARYYDGEE